MKTISKKSITFSIILLFIGVSISSGISVDNETTEDEECKECNETNNRISCIILQSILNITWDLRSIYRDLFDNNTGIKQLIYLSLVVGYSYILYFIEQTMIGLNCDIVYP